jgi:hemolysin activation/secretion protein
LTVGAVVAWLALLSAIVPAAAQQANQPGFDPRQTEKYFDQQNRPPRPAERPNLRMPQFERPQADGKPLFVLKGVSIAGASAIPRQRLAEVYQPYLGKMVSQADLAAIAESISDLYRAAGFHLSRAIIPPQDIQQGRILVRVIEGSITDVELKGDDAERFGVRPFLKAVLCESPSRLPTLERQLLLVNGLPGVRIIDTAIEEIGGPTGRFRLVVY